MRMINKAALMATVFGIAGMAFSTDALAVPQTTALQTASMAGNVTTDFTTGFLMLVGAYNNGGGGVPGQSGFFLNGSIGEVLVYDSALTDSERQSVEAYLAKKWGTTASLPVGPPGVTL